MENSEESTEDPSRQRYPMNKETLGNVYVFNHATFDDGTLGVRHCWMKDCKDIEDTFKSFNFDVIVYNDLTYSEILEKMSNIAKMDLSNIDCVVIFVLTHGKNGKVFAKDVDYYPEMYWKMPHQNSSLLSKPKLIFVQATQGDASEDDVKIAPTVSADASAPATFAIPAISDVLLMYSCQDGFNTWRSPITGSWFIQWLCNEVKASAKNMDFVTLLTNLNQKMLQRQSGALTKRQIWTVLSTLTKLLYFERGNK